MGTHLLGKHAKGWAAPVNFELRRIHKSSLEYFRTSLPLLICISEKIRLHEKDFNISCVICAVASLEFLSDRKAPYESGKYTRGTFSTIISMFTWKKIPLSSKGLTLGQLCS